MRPPPATTGGGTSAVAAFKTLPFDFIEGHVQNYLKPEAPDADFAPLAAAARASARPMPSANCFLPADLKVTGPSADPARLATYAETAFARAKSIGLTIVVFGSAGARQVLVLVGIYGFSHEEAADALNIAVGTSKAQLHRARQLLAARLDLSLEDK